LFVVDLSNKTGEHRFVPWTMIDYWHVIYADSSTCDNSASLFDDIGYTIQLLNKNRQGDPVDHFSYEKAGEGKCDGVSMNHIPVKLFTYVFANGKNFYILFNRFRSLVFLQGYYFHLFYNWFIVWTKALANN
jgi:hypothetical protein